MNWGARHRLAWRLALGLLLGLATSASAQQPVMTSPSLGTTTNNNASSTITTTNTFQLVFAAGSTNTGNGPAPRRGCTIQNNGTHNMELTEGGANAGATTSTVTKSWVLAPGNVTYCTMFGTVLIGEIDITGTSGDAFYATQY